MKELILGVGSNVNREYNLHAGLKCLQEMFGELHCSSWYESDAAGFDGDKFINLVVVVYVNISLDQIALMIKRLEADFGHDTTSSKYSAKTLDIDILSYGGLVGNFFGVELPRPEILESIYVLQPMAELVPEHKHPLTEKTYIQLFNDFCGERHNICRLCLTATT